MTERQIPASERPIRETTQMNKRVETMPDGRYMIFYTFPEIDKDARRMEQVDDRSSANASKKK